MSSCCATPWWQQLSSARSALGTPDTPPTYPQLATVHPLCNGVLSGRPAVRTVNIRQMDENLAYFLSDLRSQKASDLKQNEGAELCWYFPGSKKQFRLSGTVCIHVCDDVAKKFWNGLSYSEQRWWAWPTPGERRGEEAEFLKGHEDVVPGHFCVYVLCVDYVDVLDLGCMPFERQVHKLQTDGNGDESWVASRVNP